jgi:hypothetical protein
MARRRNGNAKRRRRNARMAGVVTNGEGDTVRRRFGHSSEL